MKSRRIALTIMPLMALAFFLSPVSSMRSSAAARTAILSPALTSTIGITHLHTFGPQAPSTAIHIAVNLTPRHIAAMRAAVTAMRTPGNPGFGRVMSLAQENRLFNPTTGQQNRVVAWLQSQGLTVTHLFSNHLIVDATGSVAMMNQAFHTSIVRYSGLVAGKHEMYFAPSVTPTVPASLRGSVTRVLGLDSAERMTTDSIVGRRLPSLTKLSAARRHGISAGYYYGSDFRAAYNVGTNNASGQHIGIVMWCDPPGSALVSAWNGAAEGAGGPISVTEHSAYAGGQYGLGEQIESDMDVEYASAAAPNSKIDYWQSTTASGSCSGGTATGDNASIESALNAAGTTTGAGINREISGSFGGCDDGTGPFDSVFAADTLTGHNFLFSSGDSGDTCDGTTEPTLNYPSDSSYVTSVGGTAFTSNQTCGTMAGNPLSSYPGEVAWCYSAPNGSGGGANFVYTEPAWQNVGHWGVWTCGSSPCRGVPDVSGPADPNQSGAAVCISPSPFYCYQVGGTSLASPLWAGFLADVQSYVIAHGMWNGAGYVPDVLWALALNPTTYANDFHDIISGVNGSYFYATTGWDPVTGLGSPNVTNLESDWYNLIKSVTTYQGPSGWKHGTKATVKAKLVSGAAAALNGRSVTFSLAGKTCKGITTPAGVASCKLQAPSSKGAKTLTASFAGDPYGTPAAPTFAFGSSKATKSVKIT